MKRQKRKMFFKELLQDNKIDSKQFKTATGSPILYTKLKKHKGIYYPLAKHREINAKARIRPSHKHACVVLSRQYGREVYANIDIWPDETARERLIQKLKGLSFNKVEGDTCTDDDEDDDDDIGIDIPTGINASEQHNSTEDTLNTKPPDDKKHVTIVINDGEGDNISSSSDKHTHHHPNPAEGHPVDEGSWPLQRSQSVNSRDNPFLPDGNLRKEADEILSKATIIRDTFILKEEQIKANAQNFKNPDKSGSNCTSANQSPVQENITQQKVVHNSECVPEQSDSPTRTTPKENGQVETDTTITPGSVSVGIIDDDKDKKKQKKCCVIM